MKGRMECSLHYLHYHSNCRECRRLNRTNAFTVARNDDDSSTVTLAVDDSTPDVTQSDSGFSGFDGGDFGGGGAGGDW